MSTKDRIDKWVSENYEWLLGEISTNIAKHQMNEYAGDLTSYLIESVYNMPEPKVIQMLDDDKLGRYLLRGAGLTLRSSTSPFFRTYRKEKMWSREPGIPGSAVNIFDREDEPYNDELYECFQEAYEELTWYHKALMDRYFYQEYTLTQMYEFYGISKNHIIKDLNQAINQIREKCQTC